MNSTTYDAHDVEQVSIVWRSPTASRKLSNHLRFWCCAVAMMFCHPGCSIPEGQTQDSHRQGSQRTSNDEPGTQERNGNPVYLADKSVTESSGLASSLRREGYFWTHNDSGDGATLYAYDKAGRRTAKVKLTGVSANDWED